MPAGRMAGRPAWVYTAASRSEAGIDATHAAKPAAASPTVRSKWTLSKDAARRKYAVAVLFFFKKIIVRGCVRGKRCVRPHAHT